MEDIEYKGFNINITDYSVIVTYDGVIMGQFSSEREAKYYIDTIAKNDEAEDLIYPEKRDIDVINEYTNLVLQDYGNGIYMVSSGESVKQVEHIISSLRKSHNISSNIYCYKGKEGMTYINIK